MLIYLAGPMAGRPRCNVAAFAEAATALRAAGYKVFSPAEAFGDVDPGTLGRSTCMRIDLAALLQVDGVAFLPGWQYSRGAVCEYLVAVEIGRPTYGVVLDRHNRPTGALRPMPAVDWSPGNPAFGGTHVETIVLQFAAR